MSYKLEFDETTTHRVLYMLFISDQTYCTWLCKNSVINKMFIYYVLYLDPNPNPPQNNESLKTNSS